MSLAIIEQVTRAAHDAAHRLAPFPITVGGQTIEGVQIEPWEGTSELMDGYRKGEETTRVSILRTDFHGMPKEAMQFSADGRSGSVRAVSTSAANYVLDIVGYKQ